MQPSEKVLNLSTAEPTPSEPHALWHHHHIHIITNAIIPSSKHKNKFHITIILFQRTEKNGHLIKDAKALRRWYSKE
jgi:hypothetical protein